MSDVQRYLRCARSGDMIPDSLGAWCRHDDADAEIDRLRNGARCPHCDELRLELGEARREIKRLNTELEGADNIANGWGRQVIEIRNLLRFFFDNVPVQYYEGYAEVMKQTEEILGHGRDC